MVAAITNWKNDSGTGAGKNFTAPDNVEFCTAAMSSGKSMPGTNTVG